MAEQLRAAAHQETAAEAAHANHERRERLAKLETAGKAEERELRESTERVRESVESQAISGAEYSPAEQTKQPDNNHHATTRELRAITYRRALFRLRKHQPATDRILSKFIHHGAVEAASESLSKTVARPSGMIGGGLFTLLGTSLLLATARHYGFQFNYLVFFGLFALGMFAGLLCEALVRLARRRS